MRKPHHKGQEEGKPGRVQRFNGAIGKIQEVEFGFAHKSSLLCSVIRGVKAIEK